MDNGPLVLTPTQLYHLELAKVIERIEFLNELQGHNPREEREERIRRLHDYHLELINDPK